MPGTSSVLVTVLLSDWKCPWYREYAQICLWNELRKEGIKLDSNLGCLTLGYTYTLWAPNQAASHPNQAQ